MTQYEAIIEAFQTLKGERTIKEIEDWVKAKYGDRWKDFGTAMADMVPESLGGNHTSPAPDRVRVLQRVARGRYCLVNQPNIITKSPKAKIKILRRKKVTSKKVDKNVVKAIQKYGNKIISLRSKLNSLSLRLQITPMFKPSVEGDRITTLMPKNVVNNEKTFKEWISDMYMYFYEASGGKNAGPPLVELKNQEGKAKTLIRWQINKLRNSFGHDAEQVNDFEKETQEKEKIRKIYFDLIGKNYPTQNNEWKKMQLSIMTRIITWLDYVLVQMRNDTE